MPPIPPFPSGPTRQVALLEQVSQSPGVPPIPVEAQLGTYDLAAGFPAGLVARKWEDPVTENPAGAGTTEQWEIFHFTADAHPIHIHEVFFEVVNRQHLNPRTGLPIRTPQPPTPTEDGLGTRSSRTRLRSHG